MEIVHQAAGMERFEGGVFVPTMGALHQGHAALIRHAAELASARGPRCPVVVSIFINPTQFNDPRDFERYPRDLDRDAELCARAGASCLFAPSVEAVYPPGAEAPAPRLPGVATRPGLEDAHRPGHFAGVCQVCRRLFDLVRPVQAVFGEKDWQQLAVIRALIEASALSLEIVAHPTIREPDGLAMSSRNRLLTPNHRRRAVALVRALIEAGRHSEPIEAERQGRRVLLASRIAPQYFVVRDAAALMPPEATVAPPRRPARVLVAAEVGGVRLIDNAAWPGFSV